MIRSSASNFQRLLTVTSDVFSQFIRNLNGNRAMISRIRRKEFCRMYDVNYVDLDGSISQLRFHEPRQVIRFPLIFEELQSEVDKKAWQARRKPKETFTRSISTDDVKINNKNYLKHFIKKK